MWLTLLEIALYVLMAALGILLLWAIVHLLWLVCLFYPILLSVCVRVFEEIPWLKAKEEPPLEPREDVTFLTSDGLTLQGSYLATTESERLGTIVFCHELTGDRWGAGPYVESLRKNGFDVFTFDFRGQGESENQPGYEPSQWATEFETIDLQAALDYLDGRPDADGRGYGVIGVSRGGTVALTAAAIDSRIQAVVTDGAFSAVLMGIFYIRRYVRIFTFLGPLIAVLPDVWIYWHMRITLQEVSKRRHCTFPKVERLLKQVTQPVLMIHGEGDRYIPREVAEKTAKRLPNLAELWFVPKAKHNQACYVAPNEYAEKLNTFFRSHLADTAEPESQQEVLTKES